MYSVNCVTAEPESANPVRPATNLRPLGTSIGAISKVMNPSNSGINTFYGGNLKRA
jgi:hypothetical protein